LHTKTILGIVKQKQRKWVESQKLLDTSAIRGFNFRLRDHRLGYCGFCGK